MKLGDGVEQGIHCVLLLAGLPPDGELPASALAEFYGVSTSYLLKHLQAMARDDILLSMPGPKELTELTFLVMAINAWNRVNVAFRTVPGSLDKAYGLDKAQLE